MKTTPSGLHRSLTLVEYFTFGFGTMVGVGWVVLIDDWLGRGGPGEERRQVLGVAAREGEDGEDPEEAEEAEGG